MYIMLEYLCPDGHRTESLEKRSRKSKTVPCLCGLPAKRTISAVAGKTVWGSAAVRGKSDPPPHGLAMDAVGRVGESVTKAEWKAERSKKWREFDRRRRKRHLL
jgi:hypothetical protein